jgi:hypothetical protein
MPYGALEITPWPMVRVGMLDASYQSWPHNGRDGSCCWGVIDIRREKTRWMVLRFDFAIATLSKSQIATSADENIDALKDGGTDAKSNLRVRSRHVNRGWVKKN